MGANSNDTESLYAMLDQMMADLILSRLNRMTTRNDGKAEKVSEDFRIKDIWSFNIHLQMGPNKIMFHTFFCTDAGIKLANMPIETTLDNQPLQNCHMFFGEFCNLVGGGTKYALQTTFKCLSPGSLGPDADTLGIPIKEIVRSSNMGEAQTNVHSQAWSVSSGDANFICVYTIALTADHLRDMISEGQAAEWKKVEIFEEGILELF